MSLFAMEAPFPFSPWVLVKAAGVLATNNIGLLPLQYLVAKTAAS